MKHDKKDNQDNVHHPAHYQTYLEGFEAIKMIYSTQGIFANGLELPKNCRTCELRRIYQHMKPCPCPAVRGSGSLVYHAKDAEQRREGCPLIGMPDDWEPITTVRVVDGQIMILPFDKETAARSYEDGIAAVGIEDLKKAAAYLQWEIEIREREEDDD